MAFYNNATFISLLTLSILLIFSLSWLVLRTLKEGRKALDDINNDSKKYKKKNFD